MSEGEPWRCFSSFISPKTPRNQRSICNVITGSPEKVDHIHYRPNPIYVTPVNPLSINVLGKVMRFSIKCIKIDFHKGNTFFYLCAWYILLGHVLFTALAGSFVSGHVPNCPLCSYLHLHKVGVKCSPSTLVMLIHTHLTLMSRSREEAEQWKTIPSILLSQAQPESSGQACCCCGSDLHNIPQQVLWEWGKGATSSQPTSALVSAVLLQETWFLYCFLWRSGKRSQYSLVHHSFVAHC